MNKNLLKLAPVAFALLIATGCATSSSQNDETKAAIAAAQQSADEAKAAAAEAQRVANEALQSAQDANARVDAAFKKSMQK